VWKFFPETGLQLIDIQWHGLALFSTDMVGVDAANYCNTSGKGALHKAKATAPAFACLKAAFFMPAAICIASH
jgi:hypothetical protein